MIKKLKNFKENLTIIFFDIIISIIATYSAYSLRLESYHIPSLENLYTYSICIIIFILVFLYFNIYDNITKYTNLYTIRRIVIASIVYSILLLILFSLYKILRENSTYIFLNNIVIPRSIGVIQPLIFCFFVSLIRVAISTQSSKNLDIKTPNIIIYGAGIAGAQLQDLIEKNNMYRVVAFIDDNKEKSSKSIAGIKIYGEHYIPELIKVKNVQTIIIAIPSLNITKRRLLVKRLKKYEIETKILPDIKDLMNNNISINDIRSLNIDDLLEREINKSYEISNKLTENKKILITGGGGSIGSELARQIILLNPKEIILVDHSEYNLYKIKEDLEKINNLSNNINEVQVTCELLSINNYDGLKYLFERKSPNVIFHAAAYKHVNLVEINIFEAIRNNFFGTLNIVKLSKAFNIEKFILISSDKAVRPTSVMGATKRLSELIVHAYANAVDIENKSNIIFSTVRFGNVLASSGSAIQKFYRQIENREPLTVTHPEVTRYFMTIYEAVHLILQTYKMSKGGEVFLLDMGKPVKILNLAKKMISLSGLTIANDTKSDGDIKIEIIGLRPGEKLYEELLIDEKSTPSKHENIFYANEEFINANELAKLTNVLELHITNFDLKKTIQTLEQYVSGFKYKN